MKLTKKPDFMKGSGSFSYTLNYFCCLQRINIFLKIQVTKTYEFYTFLFQIAGYPAILISGTGIRPDIRLKIKRPDYPAGRISGASLFV
jgi:hypothetical protein